MNARNVESAQSELNVVNDQSALKTSVLNVPEQKKPVSERPAPVKAVDQDEEHSTKIVERRQRRQMRKSVRHEKEGVEAVAVSTAIEVAVVATPVC